MNHSANSSIKKEKMNLADQIAQLNRANCDSLDTQTIAVLQRATIELRQSGILENCFQNKETSPDFVFIIALFELILSN